MESDHDVVIIGGGVIGVCSAYYLASRGVDVTLIEMGEIGSGCSYANAGLIVPSHSVPLASPGALGEGLRWMLDPESPFYIQPRVNMDLFNWLIRFVSASRRSVMLRSLPVLRDLLFSSAVLFEELAGTAGFDFGYQGKGALWVCLSRERLRRQKEEVHLFEQFNMPVQLMDQDEVHDLEPALLPQVAGGVYYPRDGHMDPAQFVIGLAEKARSLGAQLWTKTEVLGFETSNGRITGIRTTRGDIHPKQVILAAGSWSPGLMRELKVRLPIQPAKGYSITLEIPETSPRLPLFFGEAGAVVTPLGNTLRLAGTLEMAGMDFSFNNRRLNAIRRSSSLYLPGLADAKVIEIWRGLRPCTPDGLPILGRSQSFNNLIVAAGHAMLGMSLGPVTGKLVSQLACDGATDVDLAPMWLERFM